jgi:predicted RNA-binding protein Jag
MFRESMELIAPTIEEATRRALHALGIAQPDQARIEVLDRGPQSGGWSWERRPARVRVTRHVEGFGHVARHLPESLPESPQPLPAPSASVGTGGGSAGGGARAAGGSTRRAFAKPMLQFGDATPASVHTMGIEPSKPKPRQAYQPEGEDNTHVERVVKALLDETLLQCDVKFEHGEYQRVLINLEDRDAGLLIGRRGAGVDALEHLLERMASRAAGHRIPLQVDVNDYRVRQDNDRREHALALAQRVQSTGQEIHLDPMNPRDRRVVHLAIQSIDGLTTFTIGEGARRHIVITRKTE